MQFFDALAGARQQMPPFGVIVPGSLHRARAHQYLAQFVGFKAAQVSLQHIERAVNENFVVQQIARRFFGHEFGFVPLLQRL